MFPDTCGLTPVQAMSPDLVDQAILACSKPRSRKVARILTDVAAAIGLKEPRDADFHLIAGRIKALVKAGKLESEGNLDRWGFSEIQLPEK
jgi:hypothetical protein